MKILQVGKFYDPYCGGMETVVKNLCHELKDRVDLHLLVANTSCRTVHEQREFPITRVASYGTLRSSSITPSFAAWLRKLPGDIVDLHMPNPVAEVSYLMMATDRPLVAHFHSDIVKQRFLLRAYAPFLEAFYARASFIVVPTPNHISKSPFVSRFQSKCRIVPYGISVAKFDLTAPLSKKVEELRCGRPTILYVGRLVYYKGLEYLINAMPELDAQLWIVGSGPLAGELKQLTMQRNVHEKVRFLGEISDEALPAYYHACDIFVLPSVADSEMFGMVQLEAMACRKPVVSTSLPTGVSWVNQHGVTGLSVLPRDSHALAKAIKKLLDNRSLREEMGEAGRRRVESEFTAVKMAQGVLEIYRSLVH
ncbi:MAG TPA: glycosyltransferase [Candidatus Saccharimonadales bacterium]|nr:glycosyltransferase [Candidatus Saccharimonadales bacterium]